MAVETPSIARLASAAPSLDYEQLFLKGIEHIEQLSGKIWTDYNAHDPGITILEMLCYAITELGYRCDFAMGDIVEAAPQSPILNEFLSLANAGSNAPLTISDFRKLLIDIDGNRNAWLEKVSYVQDPDVGTSDPDPNASLFLHSGTGFPNALIDNSPLDGRQLHIKGLYDVYLQLEEHPEYGDLNDNSLKAQFEITPFGRTASFSFEVEFEFPVWGIIDAAVADALYDHLGTTSPDFRLDLDTGLQPSLVEDYVYSFLLKASFNGSGGNQELELEMTARVMNGHDYILNPVDFRLKLQAMIDAQWLVAGPERTMPLLVKDFLMRRHLIQERLEASRSQLANHRNLCEDFRNIHPMSLQEIGLDVDLVTDADADCVEVMANVYYLTQQYLSPTIRFYSLREMLERGYSAEEIFRGPWLLHGFIDEHELAFYQRREIIYTSDLVQAFMQIPGVRSVNHIAFARYEMGKLAEVGGDVQVNMTECLCLLNPGRYLPRLNHDRSSVRMNCGGSRLAEPSKEKALRRLSEMNAVDVLKGRAEQGDFDIPNGRYSNLSQYDSIQSEFPQNYAIGWEGLAPTETALRKAQAHQLKGYLLFFEQLLANFLSQLDNLRQLFSYSDDIDRTYFTQALYDVPRVKDLIRDYVGYSGTWEAYMVEPHPGASHYSLRLGDLAESEGTFLDRRKRFLDHLLGRFNESFSQYAAYVYGKAQDESIANGILIKDQARFLRNYVMHSHDRGTGFNYQRSREPNGGFATDWYWRAGLDVESLNQNKGGTELLPVEPQANVDPIEEFDLYQDNSGNWRFRLYNANGVNMLHSLSGYSDKDSMLSDLDLVLENGIDQLNYDTSGATAVLRMGPNTTDPAIAKVGVAFVNTYDGDADAAVKDLAAYILQLVTVDELPVENELGHALWQGVNDVTGLKKRMVFLTGLPNVNRQYINPFSQYRITGTAPNYGFELYDEDGTLILVPPVGMVFATEDDVLNYLLELPQRILDSFAEWLDGVGLQFRRVSGDPNSTIAVLLDDFRPEITDNKDRRDALLAYLAEWRNIENLHVVEHVLLRQRFLNDPTLKPRIFEDCPELNIEDPYSFRITVVLPNWAGRFTEQSFRTMFKRLMRAEAPAHVFVHFMWLDPIQMYHFEHCWTQWLGGAWDNDLLDPSGQNMATCLNGLCNTLDARYVMEPPKIMDNYAPCETIATPVDPDGEIVKALLDPATPLPAGICMHPCTGVLSVQSGQSLDENLNAFDLHIKTINAGGEEVCHNVSVQFIPNGRIRVEYVEPARRVCHYRANGTVGQRLISFVDPDIIGSIVMAEFLHWENRNPSGLVVASADSIPPSFTTTPPPGMAFNFVTGEVTIGNPSLIASGTYTFTVRLLDNSGGETIRTVTLEIQPDRIATAVVAAPKNEDAYAAGDVLATVTDPDGNITIATLVNAVPGLGIAATLPAPNVPVVVTNPTTFHAWLLGIGAPSVTISGGFYHFSLTVSTNDYCGGSSNIEIPIRVKVDNEAVFAGVPVVNVSLHNVGSLQGTLSDNLDGGLANDMAVLSANNAVLNPLGLMMAYTAGPIRVGRITVSNRADFRAAINAASPDSLGIATLNASLQTKDTTGGLSTVNAVFKAVQDRLPEVTYSPARNADAYQRNDVMATITDPDGRGIVSATFVSQGFTLQSMGLRLQVSGGYLGYGNDNSGGNLRSAPGLGDYQNLPEPIYYQEPQPGIAEILVDNVQLFRQAVATSPFYEVVDPVSEQVKLPIIVTTTDSANGFSINHLELVVVRDVEAAMYEIMNGARLNDLQSGSIMVRIDNPDPNNGLVSATVTPPLSKAFGKQLNPGRLEIVVSQAKDLQAGASAHLIQVTDNSGGVSSFSLTLTVLPRTVQVNFTLSAAQQGHILNLSHKVPGLKMLAMHTPYLAKAFGSISLNNGVQLGFTEGVAFATSSYSQSVEFGGVITTTGEPIDGLLTILRQPSKSTAVPGNGPLNVNPRLNARMAQGDAQLRNLIDETDAMALRLQNATYYPDNPVLRTSPNTVAGWANGEHDAEVSASMLKVLRNTASELQRTQNTIGRQGSKSTPSLKQRLANLAELLTLQLSHFLHYVGNVRRADLEPETDSGLMEVLTVAEQTLASCYEVRSIGAGFEELTGLRNCLFGFQDLYAETKPNLNGAILKLLPAAPLSQLGVLEQRMASPHSGFVDAELATQIEVVRFVFAELDNKFVESEFRKYWNEGPAVVELKNTLIFGIESVTKFLHGAIERLMELPQGARRMDLEHAYSLGTELMSLLTHGVFEVLDRLPQEVEGNQHFVEIQSTIQGAFTSISGQPLLDEFRNLTAAWASKWTLKPMLSEVMEASLNVATLEVSSAKVLDAYENGDVLARVRVNVGKVSGVRVSKGRLPAGLALTADGRIVVEQSSQLLPGIYGGIVLSGSIDQGFEFSLAVPDLEFEVLEQPHYIVLPAKPMSEYQSGDTLAYPMKTTVELAMAQVLAGRIPPGVRLDTENGSFTVAQSSKLVRGTYRLRVLIVDAKGGNSEHELDLVIGLDDPSAVVPLGPLTLMGNTLPMHNGQVLGNIVLPSGAVTKTTIQSGVLGQGLGLSMDGTVIVTDSNSVQAGLSQIQVLAYSSTDVIYSVSVTVEVIADLATDIVLGPIEVQLPQSNGTEIVTLTVDNDQLSSFNSSIASMPEGLSLTQAGVIHVSDEARLVAGSYEIHVNAAGTSSKYHFIIGINLLEALLPIPSENSIFAAQYASVLPAFEGQVLGNLNPGGNVLGGVNAVGGAYPAGLAVDAEGKIVVTNPNDLSGGDYSFGVRLEDMAGNHEVYLVTLWLIDLSSMNPIADRLIQEFPEVSLPTTNGRVLGQIKINGAVPQSVSLLGFGIPKGITINPNGTIVVTNSKQLYPGTFAGLVQATLLAGGSYQVEVRLSISSTTVLPRTKVGVYVEMLNLVTPFREMLEICNLRFSWLDFSEIVQVEGSLPQGFAYNAVAKSIYVMSEEDPIAGSYAVNFLGSYGQKQIPIFLNLTLVEGSVLGAILSPAELPVFVGDIVGEITISGFSLSGFTHVLGQLPPHINLNSSGQLVAQAGQGRSAGAWIARASAVDSNAELHMVDYAILLSDNDSSETLTVEWYDMDLPQTNGVVLGVIGPENASLECLEIVSGTVPAGLEVSSDGTVTVTDHTLVIEGSNTLDFVARDTEDVTYGIEWVVSFISITHGEFSRSAEIPLFAGDQIGRISSGSQTLTQVTLHSGTLPAGIELNASGYLTAAAATSWTLGQTEFTVRGRDAADALHEVVVTVTLTDDDLEESASQELPAVSLATLNATTQLGPILANELELNASYHASGSLPDGFEYDPSLAMLVVSNVSLVSIGTYNFQVMGRDETGIIYLIDLSLEITE